jgi:two-component sensor histidine kinase
MALIHEELYKGKEIDKINFSQYINELSNNLLSTYRVGNDSIILDLDIKEEILFDMDTAVPLGIIINELVSNSLKHAFRGREKGKIQIKLHYDKNVEINSNGYKRTSYILSISDNGIGINENLDIEDLDSLGLQLVTSLVDQLDGELELIRNNGTEFIIKFTLIQETNQTSSKLIQSIF